MVWQDFSPRHASRALRHVLKIKKGDIAPCKATIPDRYCKRYLALLDSGKGWIESKRRLNQSIDESVVPQQESAVGNLLKKLGGLVVSGSALTTSSVSPFSSSVAGTSTISARGSHSMPFALSSQRAMSTMNLDIWKSNNATIEMAIANFFHCKNIPDAVVELPRFVRLVRMCRLVGDNFVVPHRKKIWVSYLTSIIPISTSKTRKNFSSLPRYLDWPFWVMVQPSIKCL